MTELRYIETSAGLLFGALITYFVNIIFALGTGFFIMTLWIELDKGFSNKNLCEEGERNG